MGRRGRLAAHEGRRGGWPGYAEKRKKKRIRPGGKNKIKKFLILLGVFKNMFNKMNSNKI